MTERHPSDPFAHLHEEGFEAEFNEPALGPEGMIFMGGRSTISLNGEWNFVLDPFREGLRQRWFENDDAHIDSWTLPRDCDDASWQRISVPGCWNMARPEWFHYEGAAWYIRRLDTVAAGAGERLFLRVGAASGRARIFLNGHFLGIHHGGWTPFFAEIGPFLAESGNRLMIEVDSARRDDAVPMSHFDWFNYGGLFRDVDIVKVPEVFIADFRLDLDETGKVQARLSLSAAADGAAELSIGGQITARIPVSGGQGGATIDCMPRLWSPENPHLYPVRLSFGKDAVTDRVGFRRIQARGCEILLNGYPLDLRGICVHEDDRNTGRCAADADIRRRFQHAREMGANSVRLAHYPHSERVAQMADEAGLLLWEEIPVYWAVDFGNSGTYAMAENQLRELIRRDANRVSVIFWGIGNENADSDARLRFMSDLARTARREDPTRLVTAACLVNREEFRIKDRLAEYLDVIGLNEYFGWYEPGFDGLRSLLERSSPGRPVVISETGADALAGHRGSDAQLFTEEHQARVLSAQVEIAGAASQICGIFPWLLYDFRSERRQTRHQRGWNRKGVIAEDKTTKKLGFGALQAAYARHFTKGRT